jgi:hypothetical protein
MESMSAGLVKARIIPTPGSPIECRFNPESITLSKSSTWSRSPTRGAEAASPTEFVGTGPRSLQMELFLDAWESTTVSVYDNIKLLFALMNPTPGSSPPSPPTVVFQWGLQNYEFSAYVKSVSSRILMFKMDGTPVRAKVTLSLEETPESASAQNPTSGGIAGRRTHLVGAGDSLPSIAYAEYEDPGLWRAIAEVNGIDDPLHLLPGATLLIPAAGQAAELA